MNTTAPEAPFYHPENAPLAAKLRDLADKISQPGHYPLRSVISVLDYEQGTIVPIVGGPDDWRSTVGVLTAAAHAVVTPEPVEA